MMSPLSFLIWVILSFLSCLLKENFKLYDHSFSDYTDNKQKFQTTQMSINRRMKM